LGVFRTKQEIAIAIIFEDYNIDSLRQKNRGFPDRDSLIKVHQTL